MGNPIYGDTVGGGGGNLKKIPQADWNQIDETQLDYIKNKPDIYIRTEIDEKFALASDMIAIQEEINGVEEQIQLINEGGVE